MMLTLWRQEISIRGKEIAALMKTESSKGKKEGLIRRNNASPASLDSNFIFDSSFYNLCLSKRKSVHSLWY